MPEIYRSLGLGELADALNEIRSQLSAESSRSASRAASEISDLIRFSEEPEPGSSPARPNTMPPPSRPSHYYSPDHRGQRSPSQSGWDRSPSHRYQSPAHAPGWSDHVPVRQRSASTAQAPPVARSLTLLEAAPSARTFLTPSISALDEIVEFPDLLRPLEDIEESEHDLPSETVSMLEKIKEINSRRGRQVAVKLHHKVTRNFGMLVINLHKRCVRSFQLTH